MPGFFIGGKVGKFAAVTEQIPKLANICRRNEAPGDKIVLEDICNPFGVSFVSLLAPNRFHIFGVSQNNLAVRLQNVVNRNPILSRRFHANIFAVVFSQPGRTPAQIPSEGGKRLLL